MTDRQSHDLYIARRVEGMTNRLDRRYMNGEISHDEYNAEIKSIDKWANEQYDKPAAA
jgi:uncharacterized membrane protein